MYAVCTRNVTGIGGLTTFARVWIWVALAVWPLVFAGMLTAPPAVPQTWAAPKFCCRPVAADGTPGGNRAGAAAREPAQGEAAPSLLCWR
jgi:hypothetical protein